MANSQQQLELLLLRALRRGSNHGYGLARAIELALGQSLAIEEGSLYPALYRLEKRGDIEAQWRPTDNNRRAKFYLLTTRGQRKLDERVGLWERVRSAVAGRSVEGAA
jgi:PadR family transcriptional regulator, regulatory protein PadR